MNVVAEEACDTIFVKLDRFSSERRETCTGSNLKNNTLTIVGGGGEFLLSVLTDHAPAGHL